MWFITLFTLAFRPLHESVSINPKERNKGRECNSCTLFVQDNLKVLCLLKLLRTYYEVSDVSGTRVNYFTSVEPVLFREH